MQIHNDLEKITDFSEGMQNLRASLSICQNCTLHTSPYALCFYRQRLHKKCVSAPIHQVNVMFVSRDPNVTLQEINDYGSPSKAVASWTTPRKHGLGFFFGDFLIHNNAWTNFIAYVRNTKSAPVPRFYWTHLVKCHAYNDINNVNSAKDFCIKYLREEINQIKPVLIITAGLDVAKEVISVVVQPVTGDFKFKHASRYNQSTITQGSGIVVIPHPSQAPYQMWKQGRFYTGIDFDKLSDLINKLV